MPARDQQHAGPKPVLDALQHHPQRLCSPRISHSRHRALQVVSPSCCDDPTYQSMIDGAIVATRYVYQVRAEKREARMPRHMRVQSPQSANGGQFTPGFVRYDDVASGTKVYSAYYQDHVRAPSAAYSPANADFEGATPMGPYDPPTAGLPDYHADLDFEDGYKESELEGYGFKDMGGYDHVAPYGDEKIPEAVHGE
jgi:hypothetical protein